MLVTLTLCIVVALVYFFFFFQAEDGIRDLTVTGVQTCALPIWFRARTERSAWRSGIPRMPAVWRSLITWGVCCGVVGSSPPSVAGPPRPPWRPRPPLEGSVVVLALSAPPTPSVAAVHGAPAREP